MFDKIEAGGCEPPTKEFWVPVTYASAMGSYGDYPVGVCVLQWDYVEISFHVPHDFHQIIEAYIVVIPASTQAAANWDIFSDYGAAGEQHNTHSESDTTTTYNVSASAIFEVDISGVLTSLAAGDYVGVNLRLGDAAHDFYTLGVRFRYD